MSAPDPAPTPPAPTPAEPPPATADDTSSDAARRAVNVLGDRVLVEPPDDAERRTKGGILIPATARSVDRKGIWGVTLAVGPHVRHVAIGDEVLYLPEDAIEVDVQGEAYLIVRERDVHAVGSAAAGDERTGLYL
jgi:chaperonin GroES